MITTVHEKESIVLGEFSCMFLKVLFPRDCMRLSEMDEKGK
jgi:hypothetical protein